MKCGSNYIYIYFLQFCLVNYPRKGVPSYPLLFMITVTAIFLLIYGPVFAVLVIGGKSCTESEYAASNRTITVNIPVFFSITCNHLNVFSKVIGLTVLFQLHTFIIVILAKFIYQNLHWMTGNCRFEKISYYQFYYIF